MNCKPGDLAMVVHARRHSNLGKIVKVIRFLGAVNFIHYGVRQDCWLVEGSVKPAGGFEIDHWSRSLGGDASVPDAWLRPIRDPGEDAQDETLQWLPVPSQHKEVA